MGLNLGWLFKAGNLISSLVVLVVMVILSMIMKVNENSIKLNSYWIQLLMYYILPIFVGIVNGNNLINFLHTITSAPLNSAYSMAMIVLMLFGMILFVGRYRYINFSKYKKVVLLIKNDEVKGVLIAETSDEIYIEIDNKINRILKSEVNRIKEL